LHHLLPKLPCETTCQPSNPGDPPGPWCGTIARAAAISRRKLRHVFRRPTCRRRRGYETFVSRLDLQGHPDEPEWLGHVNAGVLKIKLAMAIIGISSIALLRTFIEAGNLGSNRANYNETGVMWQVLIHLTFVVSAIGIAYVDRLSDSTARKHED